MLNVSPAYRPYETLPGLNDLSIPAVAPLPSGESDDINLLIERFDENIIAAGLQNEQQVVYVKQDSLVELVTFLKSDPRLAYEALIDVTAVDRLKLPIPATGDDSERYHTVYQLRSYKRKQRIMVVSPVADNEDPTAPSLIKLFQGANWPEREVADLMGITFIGHPDPRRFSCRKTGPITRCARIFPLVAKKCLFHLPLTNQNLRRWASRFYPPKVSRPPCRRA